VSDCCQGHPLPPGGGRLLIENDDQVLNPLSDCDLHIRVRPSTS
jgi:hypothetical protein